MRAPSDLLRPQEVDLRRFGLPGCLCVRRVAQIRRLTEYSTQNYDLKTDLPRAEARAYAQHMDEVFAVYTQRFQRYGKQAHDRMPLYIFSRRQDYIAFLAGKGLNVANTAGIFFITDRGSGLATFVEDQPKSKVFAVLQHEGFHQFANRYLGDHLPIWINEGLAQYFEAAIVVHGKMRLGIPDTYGLSVVQAALKADATVPFDDLLSLENRQWNSVLVGQPKAAGLLYAQSWSMVYFLIKGQGGRFQPLLEKYLMLISDGRPSSTAFRDTFGTDVPAFEKMWRQYIAALQPDPINVAVERLEFFAEGLGFLQRQGVPMPCELSGTQEPIARAELRSHTHLGRHRTQAQGQR